MISFFFSNIIHAEGEHDNESLVRKLAAALKPGRRLVIKDHILDESHALPAEGAIFSLLMLLTTASGRCYSFGEISRWMEGASLRHVQQIALPPPLTSSLVIAGKISFPKNRATLLLNSLKQRKGTSPLTT